MVAEFLLNAQYIYMVEACLVFLAIIAALMWKKDAAAPFASVEAAFARLAGRPVLQALIVFAFGIGLRAAILPILGPPALFFPDEFSMMLQGQTFAEGRLANPTHPLYPFFETHYVNQLPSYSSIYFPGRGAPLALGIVLFGHPWAGVLLTMALLAVAMLWMLRAWVSPGLAFLGAILVTVRYGVLSGWINTQYGGGLIAMGGVLVLGAFPRLMKAPSWRDGILFALGLSLLMISRPFEGFFFSLPFLLVVGWKIIGALRQRDLAPVLRMTVPVFVLISASAGLLLAHNYATTGNPLLDPYSLNRQTYAYYPAFLFQEPMQPTHPVPPQIGGMYKNEGFAFDTRESLAGMADMAYQKFKRTMNFYVGPIFLIPFLLGALRFYRAPILVASAVLLSLSFSVTIWYWSQYMAAGFGLFWIYFMSGFAELRKLRLRGRPSGHVLANLLPFIAVVSLILPIIGLILGVPPRNPNSFIRPCCSIADETARTRIIEQLTADPGRDLVIYRAEPQEMHLHLTMVANEPDPDKADIVWAHELGPATQRVLDYYPDRKVWLVEGFYTTRAVPFTGPFQEPPPALVSGRRRP